MTMLLLLLRLFDNETSFLSNNKYSESVTVNQVNDLGETALYTAVQVGNIHAVAMMLNAKEEDGVRK